MVSRKGQNIKAMKSKQNFTITFDSNLKAFPKNKSIILREI